MPQDSRFKEFEIRALAGLLDTRSNPDEMQDGGYRWLESVRLREKRFCTSTGFQKFLSKDGYNNADLHDQLSGYVRQHFTFGMSQKTAAGFGKLFLGTQNRIYAFNNSSENWRVISDELGGQPESGCPEKRFTGAVLNGIAVFTNNVDDPVYHAIDQPSIEENSQAVSQIPDLERLKVTKVGLVYAWSNIMFYANVVMDGQRFTNRIIWSDYNRALSLVPGSSSLAGKIDLDSGENILGMLHLADSLFIYTSQKIWEVRVVTGAQVFGFTKRYTSKDGDRCLAYKNTLVASSDAHYFWGNKNTIYKYDFYDTTPQSVEWIDRASAYIFDDINSSKCAVHVGGFNAEHKEIWWSWAREGEDCPSMTFVINTEDGFAHYLPFGASVYVNHSPFKLKSLREWILENCVCTLAELDQYGGGFVKEGGFCFGETDKTCDVRPANFISSTPKVDDSDPEIISEDYLNPPDADALHGLLGALSEDEICGAEYISGECNAGTRFMFVLVDDQCIKEEADVYFREVCTNTSGCGSYSKLGYIPIIRSGPIALRHPSDDKIVTRFAVEVHPVAATFPSQLQLRIGVASQAIDPNAASGRCVLLWHDQDEKLLQCLSDATAVQHFADNTRPNDEMEWPLYLVGRYWYYELKIVNNSVTPKHTGGACGFSRFTFNAALSTRPIP